MTVDTFFRKLKATGRKWKIQNIGGYFTIRSGKTCPISAVLGIKGICGIFPAADKLKINHRIIRGIMCAADDRKGNTTSRTYTKYRKRLLKACGLVERKTK